jgi:hypothetical protein
MNDDFFVFRITPTSTEYYSYDINGNVQWTLKGKDASILDEAVARNIADNLDAEVAELFKKSSY